MIDQQAVISDAWVDEMKRLVTELAERSQNFVDRSLAAFFSGDAAAAEELIEFEERLDRLEVQLEEYAITVLERTHINGYCLRFVVSVLKTNNDLERMADLGVDICYASLKLGKLPPEEIPALLPLMIARSKNMIDKSVKAIMTEDVGLCLEVRGEDVVIDRYAREIAGELAHTGKDNPEQVPRILQIHNVVRAIERLADLSSNIAENIIYLVEGTIVRHTI
ncbi:MAG: PhoU domain-containing protein [Candidatus Brocadiia bacterium]